MPTIGSKFDEVAEEAPSTNENNEVPQQTPAIHEDSTVAVTHGASQGTTTEREGDMIQARNQNAGGGVMARVSEIWRQWRSRPVSQCSYKDADPNITSYKAIYNKPIEGSTKTPYPFKFHAPAHIITGIACLPKDAETSSPEVEVVRGGVGFKEVEIILTPVEKGNWCCCVLINGIEDNRLEMDSTSYKELSM